MSVKRKYGTKTAPMRISLSVPRSKGGPEVIRRLQALAAQKKRSMNYLVIEAIIQYLQREEAKLSSSSSRRISTVEVDELEGIVLFRDRKLREGLEEAREDISAGRIRDVDELISQTKAELASED